MVSAIIAAGGKGTRMGAGINKAFIELDGKEIIARTVDVFEKAQCIDEIIIVTGKSDILLFNAISKKYNFQKISAVVCGGDTRSESVYNGLMHAAGDIVMIHDAARALITEKEIFDVLSDCKKFGAAALGVKCKDTLKVSENGFISGTLNRDTTYLIQTPQVFYREEIIKAHELARDNTATDDCALAEKIGIRIKITDGSYDNIKLTTPSDMAIAKEILKGRKI